MLGGNEKRLSCVCCALRAAQAGSLKSAINWQKERTDAEDLGDVIAFFGYGGAPAAAGPGPPWQSSPAQL